MLQEVWSGLQYRSAHNDKEKIWTPCWTLKPCCHTRNVTLISIAISTAFCNIKTTCKFKEQTKISCLYSDRGLYKLLLLFFLNCVQINV